MYLTSPGDPAPTVKWAKDGRDVIPSPRLRVSDNNGTSSLDIWESKIDDSGEYVCTATNKYGTVTHAVKVEVIGKKKI